jgi:hypothetical protein
MFNPNNLVFVDKDILESVRAIPLVYLKAFLGVLLLSYLLRSLATWSMSRVLSPKGSTALSFIPFMKVVLHSRLGKEVCGYGPRTILLSKLFLVLYFIGLVLALISPKPNLMFAGFILLFVSYLVSTFIYSTVSLGVTGKSSFLWYLPIIGSIAMLVAFWRSYSSPIFVKPRNLDGLFKKQDELEIEI